MTATEAQIKAWLNDPASGQDVYRRNWKNACQALVYQVCLKFGVARTIYSSATKAREDSVISGGDIREAPRGAVHYWDYWATIDGVRDNYGHVGVDTRGGGVGVMSTGRGTQWANGVGLIDFVDWNRVMGRAVTYRGWALSNGDNSVSILPGRGEGLSTLDPEDEMTPEEKRQLAEIHQAIYASPGHRGWQGFGELIPEIYRVVADIRQAIFVRASDGPGLWDGLDEKLVSVLEKLDTLSATDASDGGTDDADTFSRPGARRAPRFMDPEGLDV